MVDEDYSLIGQEILYDPRLKNDFTKNRSRNYIRYQVSRNFVLDTPKFHPLLTEEEKFLLTEYNSLLQALTNVKIRFFSDFYDNCPKVGCTLTRKRKAPTKEQITELPW